MKAVWGPLPREMFMLGKPSTRPDSGFPSVLTSADCANSEVFVHVGLSEK